MKKTFSLLFLLCSMFILSASESIVNEKSNIIKESVDISDDYCVNITWYKMYNQAIFTVINYKNISYDFGNMEKLFYETIENWIKEESHKYYHYSVTNRKSFYSRKYDKTDNKSYQVEFKVNLRN